MAVGQGFVGKRGWFCEAFKIISVQNTGLQRRGRSILGNVSCLMQSRMLYYIVVRMCWRSRQVGTCCDILLNSDPSNISLAVNSTFVRSLTL